MAITITDFENIGAIALPALSAAANVRIVVDAADNTLKASTNGGAYLPFAFGASTSPWDEAAGNVRLVTSGNTVSVGTTTAPPAGTKMSVLADVAPSVGPPSVVSVLTLDGNVTGVTTAFTGVALSFRAENTAGTMTSLVQFGAVYQDVTLGAETASVGMFTLYQGTAGLCMSMGPDGIGVQDVTGGGSNPQIQLSPDIGGTFPEITLGSGAGISDWSLQRLSAGVAGIAASALQFGGSTLATDDNVQIVNSGGQFRIHGLVATGAALTASVPFQIVTGDRIVNAAAAGANSGNIDIATGLTNSTNAGGTGGASGSVTLGSGNANSTLGTSGGTGTVAVFSGDSVDAGSGSVFFRSGAAGTLSGSVLISTGTPGTGNSGDITLTVANITGAAAASGGITGTTGNATASGGVGSSGTTGGIFWATGTSTFDSAGASGTAGNTGSVEIVTGNSEGVDATDAAGTTGDILLTTGDSITTGTAAALSDVTGDIQASTGSSTTSDTGAITLTTGDSGGTDNKSSLTGDIRLTTGDSNTIINGNGGNSGVISLTTGSTAAVHAAASAGDSGGILLQTGNSAAGTGTASGASGAIDIATGTTEDQASGSVSIVTGGTTAAAGSGDIVLQIGTAPSNRGTIQFQADVLELQDNAFQITLNDAQAAALSIGSTGLLNALVFTTTNSAERVTANAQFQAAAAFYLNVTSITFADSPYTILATDNCISGDPAAGNIVANLPSAAANPNRVIVVSNSVTSGNTVAPTPTGGDTIDGGGAGSLTSNQTVTLIALPGTTNWKIIGST